MLKSFCSHSNCIKCTAQFIKSWSSRSSTAITPPEEHKKPAGLKGKNWKEFQMKQKMGHDKWMPSKRLTWYQIEHLKTLKRMQPEDWSNSKLSRYFGISVPAVVKILQSKFEAPVEVKERQDKKALEQTKKRQALFKKTLLTEGEKPEKTEDINS